MAAVLMVIISIACILLLLGMVVGDMLKHRAVPRKKESFIVREMKRIDSKEGKS